MPAHDCTLLQRVVDEWVDVGLTIEPADRGLAERAVMRAYEAADLAPPQTIVWVDSPLAGAYAQAILQEIGMASEAVREEVWSEPLRQAQSRVLACTPGRKRQLPEDWVLEQVQAIVVERVGEKVRGRLWQVIWDEVWYQQRDAIQRNIWRRTERQISQIISAPGWRLEQGRLHDQLEYWKRGLNESSESVAWSSWLDAISRSGATYLEPWQGIAAVAKSCHWWWVFDDCAVLCERPRTLRRDDVGRLHCADGMAVVWPDGWGFHSWHGVTVPDWVIIDPTVERILAESDPRVRLAAIERLSWHRYVAASEMKPLGHPVPDPSDAQQMLELYELPEELDALFDEHVRLLLGTRSSAGPDDTRRGCARIVRRHHDDPASAAAEPADLDPTPDD